MYALRSVVVNTHARMFTMYYSCICQARAYVNKTHEICGKNMCAHANQNAQVHFVQTKMHECSSCKQERTSAVCPNKRCT